MQKSQLKQLKGLQKENARQPVSSPQGRLARGEEAGRQRAAGWQDDWTTAFYAALQE